MIQICTTLAVVALLLSVSGCVDRASRVSSVADVELLERRTSQQDSNSLAALSLGQINEAISTPIELLGVVVDEAGQPIRNAQISAVVFDQLLDPMIYPYIGFRQLAPRTSGRKGRFALRGLRGAALQVKVSHPAYVGVAKMQRTYVFHEALASLRQVLDPAKGVRVRFVMKPAALADTLVEISTGAVKVFPGRKLHLSLRQLSPYGVPSSDADIHILCSGMPIVPRDPTPWWCELRAARGGGLQEVKRLETEFAPKIAAGYAPMLRFEYHPEQPGWRTQDIRELFVRTPDGLFAKVELRMRPVGEFYLSIDGQLNRSGERRIER